MICTFFGHHDCPPAVIPKLKAVLEDLIIHYSVEQFYVGNHGYFDFCVQSVLKDLSSQYPQIHYFIVLAYVPNENIQFSATDFSHMIFPIAICNAPPKLAILYRNKWMEEQSDLVVTYITRSSGGAVKFARLAQEKKKIYINLAI